MNTSDTTYRVCAARYGDQFTIKGGFQTREDAQRYLDEYCYEIEGAGYYRDGHYWRVCVVEDKAQRQKYYEFIDSLLENARRELSSEDMVELINDLGVVLDMHFDGIRREIESEYAEE